MRLQPLELADIHLDALYERDAAGLVIASRDPQVTPPPFHLVRTRAGNRWLLSARLEPPRRQLLASILAQQPAIAHVIAIQIGERRFPFDTLLDPRNVRVEVPAVELLRLGGHAVVNEEALDDLGERRIATQIGPPQYSCC